jgi:hypothetical protein
MATSTPAAELMLKVDRKEWLLSRGRRVPPRPLPPDKEAEVMESFQLMDGDGSGALDSTELQQAFQLLGYRVRHCGMAPLSALCRLSYVDAVSRPGMRW